MAATVSGQRRTPGVTVILSTYNSPDYLEKVLWGYACQTDRDFDIVVADDGSSAETAARIDTLRGATGLELRHVWQEDRGFRKCRILNEAIRDAPGEYLILSDGDCVPRRDFVAVHRRLAARGRFLSGGYLKLPAEASAAVSRESVESGSAFDIRWLEQRGLRRSKRTLKLTAEGRLAAVLDAVVPTPATWNGHNSSAWKVDVVAVNGFDERMGYGGEDGEMGDRLRNRGVRPRRIRYRAKCLHLHHSRGYVTAEMLERNRSIRAETRRRRRTFTPCGMERSVRP